MGAVDIRSDVIETMAVNGRVRGPGCKVAGVEETDLAPNRESLGRYIRPGFAVITGELDKASVSARPYLSGGK